MRNWRIKNERNKKLRKTFGAKRNKEGWMKNKNKAFHMDTERILDTIKTNVYILWLFILNQSK